VTATFKTGDKTRESAEFRPGSLLAVGIVAGSLEDMGSDALGVNIGTVAIF